MTDNEKKLIEVEKKVEWLKTVNEFMPALTALLLIGLLVLCISLAGSIFKIQNTELKQNDFQQSALETRKRRDSAQAKLLESNAIQVQLLTLILKDQADQLVALKAAISKIDSLKNKK